MTLESSIKRIDYDFFLNDSLFFRWLEILPRQLGKGKTYNYFSSEYSFNKYFTHYYYRTYCCTVVSALDTFTASTFIFNFQRLKNSTFESNVVLNRFSRRGLELMIGQ